MSTAKAILLILIKKANHGDPRAAALADKIHDMAGLGSTMTDEQREKRGIRLPAPRSHHHETFLLYQPQLEKDRQRYLAMAEFTGDHGEQESPKAVPSAIKSGDVLTVQHEFEQALAQYRSELVRCKNELTANRESGAAQYDFCRAVARIGLLANRLLLEGNFQHALETANEAISEGTSAFYSFPKLGFFDHSIFAAAERVRWIRLIHANALMLLGNLDKAKQSLLAFRRAPSKKFRLSFDWEDTVFRDFALLRRAGYAHFLMTDIEHEFFDNGRVRNRDGEIVPNAEGLPHADEIQSADTLAKQQPEEALAVYRRLLSDCEAESTQSKSSRIEQNLLVSRIGLLAWPCLLGRKEAAALTCADTALAYDPYSSSLNFNRAHALMFLGRVDEARAIYLGYIDKMMSGEDTANVAIQKDFGDLRKIGRENKLMSEVERRFADVRWGERLNRADAADSPIGKLESKDLPVPREPRRPRGTSSLPLAERDDLSSATELLSQGKLDEAFQVCQRRIVISKRTIAKGVPNLQAHTDRHGAIIKITDISLALLVAGDYAKALEVAEDAIAEEHASPFGNVRRAHALMFLNRLDEAHEIYLAFHAQRFTPERTGAAVILGDFETMREAGHVSALMNDIESMFKQSNATARNKRIEM